MVVQASVKFILFYSYVIYFKFQTIALTRSSESEVLEECSTRSVELCLKLDTEPKNRRNNSHSAQI